MSNVMPGGGHSPAALAGIRVIDLTTNSAAYAGKLLADLGADVIRVEPPEGSPVRRLAPVQRLPSGEVFSFAHAFFDANKRSVLADLATPAGRSACERFVASADVVIDTPESGEVVARSIDYGAAAAKNPRLIITSITPYGCGGPYAARRATDLVSLAAGGLLSLGGYADTEPIAIGGGQAHLAAAIFSVVGILAALVAREESGRGRWIDVSTQECVAFALEDAVPEWYINRRLRRRNGARAREAGTGIYPCQDGFVSIVAGRLGTAKAFVALAEWIAASDIPGAEALRDPRWSDFRFRQSDEGIAQFADLFAKFCAMRSKQELYREGQNRQIAIAPVNTIADVMCDAQLASNGYFQSCFQAALGKNVTFPGAPYRLARTPPRPAASVPSLGQHNSELLESAQSRPFAALD